MTLTGGSNRADVLASDHLVSVVRQLAASRNVDEVAAVVRRAARELTGADGATFVLREEGSCHYVDEDAISPLWKGRRFPLEHCITGWAMLHRRAVVIPDIYADDRIPHDAYRPTFVRSLVVVPIRTAEPLGAIGTYWSTERHAEAWEVELLQALADSTAVAMENVRVYAELEARVEARTEALARANDELRQLAAHVAHDIRSPLTTIAGLAELLVARHGDAIGDDARRVAQLLLDGTANLAGFTNDLLEYLAGSRDPQRTHLDMAAIAAEVVRRVDGLVNDRGASVTWANPPLVSGDRVLITQALQNLVANAITYTPRDRHPVVTISVEIERDDWLLRVADNGAGIPLAEREAVVEPFRRGSAAAGHTGSGLGLALCQRIAEHHGGGLTIDDAPGGGAIVTLRIPHE